MADLPRVTRLDLDDNQLAFVALMLQSLQAKLQVDIPTVLRTGQSIVAIHHDHPEVLVGIGRKVDAVLSQELYDKTVSALLGVRLCPDCGQYHD